MNKDVIYIDVDEDITAIIGKVKDAKEKIVAIVPPKRTGVLQSAVNLRILQRVAKQSDKHLVLITNDQSLMPLAAGAAIPVAKNLQSKPEIPEVPALKVDGEDDIIDGSELSVEEHARAGDKKARASDKAAAAAIAEKPLASPPAAGEKPKRSKAVQKVPNFNKFRKKLFIVGGLLLLLIGFGVWATFFAPRATVEIMAKTSTESVNTGVTLRQDATTDVNDGTIKSVVVSEKEEAKVEFVATGTEEEGKAASGSMTLTRSVGGSVEVPAGTGFSSGECTFVSSREVRVPGASLEIGGAGIVPGTVDVSVKATDIGDQCNLSSRRYDPTVKGISARGDDMSGGDKRTFKIVTQSDVQKAAEKLATQKSDDKKAALEKKFKNNITIIEGSFTTERTDAVSSPKVGEEASDGKATLTSATTYTLTGVDTAELDTFLKKALETKLSKENEQRVYDSGKDDASFSDFATSEEESTAVLIAKGQVGPQLDDNDVKNRVKGKRFGDIQSDLKSIQGVDDVEVKFWPFWVNTVPDEDGKIKVEFKLEKST